MVKKIMATSVVVGSMFAFVGCGSDSDTTAEVATGTSYYIDSAVSGINYTCGSQEGITDAEGTFTFDVGASCTFYLGDIELRTVAVEELVDGESVVETDVEIARILQSLDSDGNLDNGITIDAAVVEAMAEAGITTLPDTAEELAVFEEVLLDNELTLVSTDEAQSHLDETVSELLLAGKTFYMAGQDVNDLTDIWGGVVTFNTDLTELTVVEETGVTETESISIEGDRLVFADNTDGSYTVIGDDKGDYIEVTDYYSDGTLESHTRLYYEESKADTYLASLNGYIAITDTMLSGKTFYDSFIGYNDETCYANMTMSSTSATRYEICENASGVETVNETVTFTVALIDGKIRVDTEDEYKWFTLISEDDTAWHMINDDDEGKDGTLDKLGEENTWYLSKPVGFPDSL